MDFLENWTTEDWILAAAAAGVAYMVWTGSGISSGVSSGISSGVSSAAYDLTAGVGIGLLALLLL